MRALALVVLMLCGCTGGPPPTPQAPEWSTGEWERACRYDVNVLPELSGMTASQRHRDIVWALNDSGQATELIALDTTSCQIRGIARVSAPNTDWEALAAGNRRGRFVLFIGDIGDNTAGRSSVAVAEVPEPDLGNTTVAARIHSFRYPDGPVDAEALMARGTKVWVLTKQFRGAMYRVRLATGTARRVGSAPSYATDAALSPTQDIYAVRDYPTIRLFRGMPPGTAVGRSTPPQQPQAEAVTFSTDGRWLYTASENDRRLLRTPIVQR